MSATTTTTSSTATTTTTTTTLVTYILSEAIVAADGDTTSAIHTNTYVCRLIAHSIPAPTATSGLIRLILVDTATQAQERNLTTLAFIDVCRTNTPTILNHATSISTTTTKNNQHHNHTTRAILKAVHKTLRIERHRAPGSKGSPQGRHARC
jgi:hypothetical protein